MRERPILFSGPMVRAVLAGQKTQTRRVAKEFAGRDDLDAILRRFPNQNGCPYGQPGDRLWVREAHAIVPRTAYAGSEGVQQVIRKDGPYEHDAAVFREGWTRSAPGRWRPSIHMPRWASRITLEIVSVLVERLQAISEADAQAEGVEGHYIEDGWYWRNYLLSDADAAVSPMMTSAKDSFRSLWESINGADSWAANPWVWAVEFRRITL